MESTGPLGDDGHRLWIFPPAPNPTTEQWDGAVLSIDVAKSAFGAHEAIAGPSALEVGAHLLRAMDESSGNTNTNTNTSDTSGSTTTVAHHDTTTASATTTTSSSSSSSSSSSNSIGVGGGTLGGLFTSLSSSSTSTLGSKRTCLGSPRVYADRAELPEAWRSLLSSWEALGEDPRTRTSTGRGTSHDRHGTPNHLNHAGMTPSTTMMVWPLSHILSALKWVKSPAEQHLMRGSARVAVQGIRTAMRDSIPGHLESHLCARFEYDCKRLGP